MKYSYITSGTCSRNIDFEIENGVITNVSFNGGCNGNLKGISALVNGLTPSQVIERLKGIQCGHKGTSCPDQLARALEQLP
ncbi:MAG: TIGR03905 family TSCPD domain-containing protein [Muribaculaceae bacterium]|nr:TIGR03905 family TSCPD domain-containing protein [Muribaculaceae bacterium]